MGDGERRRGGGCKKKSELTESGLGGSKRGSDNSGGVGKSSVSIISTDNNGGIDKTSINKSGINNANVSTSSNVGVNKDDNKSNINTRKAKFEEDIKKEPILQTILDMFDGELL